MFGPVENPIAGPPTAEKYDFLDSVSDSDMLLVISIDFFGVFETVFSWRYQ